MADAITEMSTEQGPARVHLTPAKGEPRGSLLLTHGAGGGIGGVDLVVNNAGVGIGGQPVGSIGVDDWEWALGINLWGVVYGCEVFAPLLRAHGGGIVNVASVAGVHGIGSSVAYAASKGAISNAPSGPFHRSVRHCANTSPIRAATRSADSACP